MKEKHKNRFNKFCEEHQSEIIAALDRLSFNLDQELEYSYEGASEEDYKIIKDFIQKHEYADDRLFAVFDLAKRAPLNAEAQRALADNIEDILDRKLPPEEDKEKLCEKEVKPEDDIELLQKICPPPTEEAIAKLEKQYADLQKAMKKIRNPYDSSAFNALEKIDHTVCLNINNNTLKFGIDTYDHWDCNDFHDFVSCYEAVERALWQGYELIRILRKYVVFDSDGGMAFKGLSSAQNKQDYNFLLDLCKQG